MPGKPRKGRRFGGSSQHQKLMMANLVSSLIAAEGITTTQAKAKALRPDRREDDYQSQSGRGSQSPSGSQVLG